MIIDIHTHLWNGRFEECKRELLKGCMEYGISKIYASSLGSFYPDEDEIQLLNDETYKFMKESPDQVGGFCYINPLHKGCVNVLQKGIEDYGMSGMKLWVSSFCDHPKVFPLIEKCIEYRIPILLHAFHKSKGQLEFESLGENVANLAFQYPEAKLIMAHLGGNCYREIKAIREYSNVLVDISGSSYRKDDLSYTIKRIGIERILFGSDQPDASFLVNYGQVEEAELEPFERELIYSGNALKLLKRG